MLRPCAALPLVLLACGGTPAPAPTKTAPAPTSSAGNHGNLETSRDRVATIGAAAATWRAQHGAACPTYVQLLADGPLDPNYPQFDGWGNDVSIACTPGETRIVSAGPDGKPGDGDDVVDARPVPARQAPPDVPRAYGTVAPPRLPPSLETTAAPPPPPDPYAQARTDFALRVQQCFVQAIKLEPGLGGQVKVLPGTGPCVAKVTTTGLTPPDSPALKPLADCIEAAARSVGYACPPDGGAPFSSPFTFSAGH